MCFIIGDQVVGESLGMSLRAFSGPSQSDKSSFEKSFCNAVGFVVVMSQKYFNHETYSIVPQVLRLLTSQKVTEKNRLV